MSTAKLIIVIFFVKIYESYITLLIKNCQNENYSIFCDKLLKEIVTNVKSFRVTSKVVHELSLQELASIYSYLPAIKKLEGVII